MAGFVSKFLASIESPSSWRSRSVPELEELARQSSPLVVHMHMPSLAPTVEASVTRSTPWSYPKPENKPLRPETLQPKPQTSKPFRLVALPRLRVCSGSTWWV